MATLPAGAPWPWLQGLSAHPSQTLPRAHGGPRPDGWAVGQRGELEKAGCCWLFRQSDAGAGAGPPLGPRVPVSGGGFPEGVPAGQAGGPVPAERLASHKRVGRWQGQRPPAVPRSLPFLLLSGARDRPRLR